MKRNTIVLATLIAATVPIVLLAFDGGDAPFQNDIGVRDSCCCEGPGTLDPYGPIQAHGQVTVEWVANSGPADPVAWSDLQVVSFRNSQDNAELGNLSWTLDDSRLLTSRIEALQPGTGLPAKSTIRWHARVEALGIQYQTIDPIEMEGTINQWPKVNTPYHQVAPVRLERVDQPGETAFTMTDMSITVNQDVPGLCP